MPKVNQTERQYFAQKKVLDLLKKSKNGKRQLAATGIYHNVLPKKLTQRERRRMVKIVLSEPIIGKFSFSISCGDLETMKVETVLYHIRKWGKIDSGTYQTILSCDNKRLGDRYYIHQCVGLRELLQKKKNLKCNLVPKQTYVSLLNISESSSEEEEHGTDVIYETSDDEDCWV